MKVGQIWETWPEGGGSVLTVRLTSVTPHPNNPDITPSSVQYCPIRTPWETTTIRAIEIQNRRWKLIADVGTDGYPVLPRSDDGYEHVNRSRMVNQVRNQMFDFTPDVAVPSSEYIERVRNMLSNARSDLEHLKTCGVAYGEDCEPAIGALTCAIVSLFYVMDRAKKHGA